MFQFYFIFSVLIRKRMKVLIQITYIILVFRITSFTANVMVVGLAFILSVQEKDFIATPRDNTSDDNDIR